jgi:hypothetical protein
MIIYTHPPGWIVEINAQLVHPFNNGSQGLYSIAIHNRSVLLALLSIEPLLVYDPIMRERDDG